MPQRCIYPAVLALSMLGAVLLAWSRPAQAQGPRRVGIVVTVAVNMRPNAVDTLTEAMARVLEAELPIDVIAGAEARRRLPPGRLPEGCVAESGCRQDLGQRLDAAELLLLVIVRVGDRVQIDPTWADVASGKVVSRAAITLDMPASVAREPASQDALFEGIGPELLPHLVEKAAPATPPQAPPQAQPQIIVIPAGERDGAGSRMSTGVWIAAGVGAAALIGGTVFGLSARGKFDALDSDGCRREPCSQTEVDSLERHALAADLLFAASLTAGVTAVVLYLRNDGPSASRTPGQPTASEREPGLTLGVGPGQLGLALGGAF